MTIASPDGAVSCDTTIDPEPAESLAALCHLVRSSLGVTAASVCFGDGSGGALAVAPEADADDFRFATMLDGRPDAAEPSMIVADACADARLAAWPPVAVHPGVRMVASLPLGAAAEGRLALFDVRPRPLDAAAIGQLQDFAALGGSIAALAARARIAEAGEAEFRRLAEASTDTIVRGTLDGIRRYVSPSVRDLLGYAPEELVGRRASEIVHLDDLDIIAAMNRGIAEGLVTESSGEMRQRHKDGSWVWIEAFLKVTHCPSTGRPDGYVVSVRGVGRRKAIEAELARRADHDDLTGLPNRKLFREKLLAAVSALDKGGPRFALLWMDLDRFKDVNDSLGHPAGDAVLVEAGERFRSAVDPGDLVARLGGDEFVVIHQPGEDGVTAEALAARLLSAMEAPFTIGDRLAHVGVSIGIAHAPDDAIDADGLLAAADAALYRAKSAGRGAAR